MWLSLRPPHLELLSSRFEHPSRSLFFTRARLYMDRIELSGWDLRARYRREIPLNRLCYIEWEGEGRAVLHLRDAEEPMTLVLHEPAQWRKSLEERLRWIAPDRPARHADRRDLPLDQFALFASSMG